MPRRRSIKIGLVIVAVLVCCVLTFVVSRRTAEASFQGHSSSYWLRQTVRPRPVGAVIFSSQIPLPPGSYSYGGLIPPQAREAFNKMGTNAEPVLVEAILARENTVTKSFRRLYPRLPGSIRKLLPEPFDPLALRSAALFVLQSTGSIDIAPKLLPWLKEPDLGLRLAILSVVAQPDASQVPFLLLASDDPSARVRSEVLRHLSQIGPSALSAVPVILKLCADSDINVRQDAAWALWKITGQTNTAVPVLESTLTQRQDETSHDRVAYHLLLMGDSAPLLVNTLISSLTNSEAGVRANVYSLLRDIGS